MERACIRVSTGANACTRAHPFAIVVDAWGRKRFARRCMGLCIDGNKSRETEMGRAQMRTSRAQMLLGHVQTAPKTHKTLEGHISLKTCPNRAFEVFFWHL